MIIAGTFERTEEGGWVFKSSGGAWKLPAGAVPRFNQFAREIQRAEAARSKTRKKTNDKKS